MCTATFWLALAALAARYGVDVAVGGRCGMAVPSPSSPLHDGRMPGTDVLSQLALVDWLAIAAVARVTILTVAAELPKLDAYRRHLAAGILALAACFGFALRTTVPEVSFHFRQFASEEAQARAKRYRRQRDGLNQIMMVAE